MARCSVRLGTRNSTSALTVVWRQGESSVAIAVTCSRSPGSSLRPSNMMDAPPSNSGDDGEATSMRSRVTAPLAPALSRHTCSDTLLTP